MQSRSGQWFDPALVDTLVSIAKTESFVDGLKAQDIRQRIMAMAPAQANIYLDDDYFDDIVSAFGKIVDAKSPYTADHSQRVAIYADLIAEQLGIDPLQRRWLKRAALLHDLGKLGVSNTILDKPDKLNDQEWEAVKAHASLTEQILINISAFRSLATISAAHHEKLDGTGYPRQLAGEEISLMTRIITTADIFDAITAERPYRGAIPIPQALAIMQDNLHTAIDVDCFNALTIAIKKLPEWQSIDL